MGEPVESACVPVPCPLWEETTLELDLTFVPTLAELRQAGAVYAAPGGMHYAERDGRVVLVPRPGSMELTPVNRDEARSLIGGGIHTALRKAVGTAESMVVWDAIDALPDDQWSAALNYLIQGLESMGYRLYRNPGEGV